MKKSYIGEIGELSVFMKLLKQNCEVYRANSKIQVGWDLVVILKTNAVKRIQVKTTILENKSTNNSLKIIGNYDYLVLVIIDQSEKLNYYILTREEVTKTQKNNKLFSVTQKENGKKKIISSITNNKDKWNKIKEVQNGKNN